MLEIFNLLLAFASVLKSGFESIIWIITSLPALLEGVILSFGFAPDFIQPFLYMSLSITATMAILKLI